MSFKNELEEALKKQEISEKIYSIFLQLYESYAASLHKQGLQMEPNDWVFEEFLKNVKAQIVEPYTFLPYHSRITDPYDYFSFGISFIRPLVDKEKSRLEGLSNVKEMNKQLEARENVVLFANHQTEVDPQLLSMALEKDCPRISQEIIFVAGDRVVTDPMAVPFSMGRNLLCIYSKRHIENPPEKKEEKLLHNQRTMKLMRELFSEGGKCIYVAPSGGRDRRNENGEVVVSPFDPQSIEMFRLMAKQANRPTHFYTLALCTYEILPPPKSIEKDVGEMRRANRDGVLFSFGKELDMERFPGHELEDRHARRAALASYIWNIVKKDYDSLKNL